eukprot:9502486-Pyramimonas_sp.AAC.2
MRALEENNANRVRLNSIVGGAHARYPVYSRARVSTQPFCGVPHLLHNGRHELLRSGVHQLVHALANF